MRKITPLFLPVMIALITVVAEADTIHLKNGSVIKGKVASFADDQFIVLLDTGSGRSMSRAMIYMGDVARIEFDSPPAGAADSGPQRDTSPITQPRETQTRDTQPRDTSPAILPRETQPRESLPSEPPPSTSTREPEASPTERPSSSSAPVIEASDTDRPVRKSSGAVKTTSVDVSAKRDWTSTGLLIKRGDRIRISAAGAITLDPASGQTSGPEGIELADSKKLMGDHPTGALIGVIGADNDDFIFIGRTAEFTAAREGLLFLSVNEGGLSDNTGVYKATIEVQRSK